MVADRLRPEPQGPHGAGGVGCLDEWQQQHLLGPAAGRASGPAGDPDQRAELRVAHQSHGGEVPEHQRLAQHVDVVLAQLAPGEPVALDADDCARLGG